MKRQVQLIYILVAIIFFALVIFTDNVENRNAKIVQQNLMYIGIVDSLRFDEKGGLHILVRNKWYYVSHQLDGFDRNIKVGDSVSKMKGDFEIKIYKGRDNK